MVLMEIVLPPGAAPGMTIQVMTPSGPTKIQVPPGCSGGMRLRLDVQAAPQEAFQQNSDTTQAAMQEQRRRAAEAALERQRQALYEAQNRRQRESLHESRAQQDQEDRAYSKSSFTGVSRTAPGYQGTPYRNGGNVTCTGITADYISTPDWSSWCYLMCCVCSNPVPLGFTPCFAQTLYTVDQGEVAIVASNGKFSKMAPPGPVLLSRPCLYKLEDIVGRLSTRVQQLDVPSESKTKDNSIISIR